MFYVLFLVDIELPKNNNGYIIGNSKTPFSILVKK